MLIKTLATVGAIKNRLLNGQCCCYISYLSAVWIVL